MVPSHTFYRTRVHRQKKRVRLTCLPARPQGCVCAIRRQGRAQTGRKATRKLGNVVLSSLGRRIYIFILRKIMIPENGRPYVIIRNEMNVIIDIMMCYKIWDQKTESNMLLLYIEV